MFDGLPFHHGTACIADSGLVVNDSHAEIVARRGFMRFCYDQIQLLLSDDEEVRKSSIFIKKSNRNASLIYRCKKRRSVHIYDTIDTWQSIFFLQARATRNSV